MKVDFKFVQGKYVCLNKQIDRQQSSFGRKKIPSRQDGASDEGTVKGEAFHGPFAAMTKLPLPSSGLTTNVLQKSMSKFSCICLVLSPLSTSSWTQSRDPSAFLPHGKCATALAPPAASSLIIAGNNCQGGRNSETERGKCCLYPVGALQADMDLAWEESIGFCSVTSVQPSGKEEVPIVGVCE